MRDTNRRTRATEWLIKAIALALAAAIWIPCVQVFFTPDVQDYRTETGIPPKARKLAMRHLALWTDPDLPKIELEQMQARNPEWDFMSRTYFVLALANMALRDASMKPQALDIIDTIVKNTLRIEREKGTNCFLLGYARGRPWHVTPQRSIFIDGEIALMLAARRMVEEHSLFREALAERVEIMTERMRKSPILCAESYPDECWLFCNTVALAAIRMHEVLDGTDHSALLQAWLTSAKANLIEPETGLLISAFSVDGTPAPCGFGPEGSSIWMACHMLQIVDPAFADDQYRRAKRELAGSVCGFGYSREWPACCPGSMDVDSGPIVPSLGASASASGLAILGAAVFDDREYLERLLTSLELAGFPNETDTQLRFNASNPVGDAVLLYALVEGPLWEAVRNRSRHAGPTN